MLNNDIKQIVVAYTSGFISFTFSSFKSINFINADNKNSHIRLKLRTKEKGTQDESQ
jgi:hypothetical protein|tara:strand:+ start:108 stop:278 length:171 start_codon:yes stop_codon:yes gene_type:complete